MGMSRRRKGIGLLVAAALMLVVLPTEVSAAAMQTDGSAPADEGAQTAPAVTIEAKENQVPVYEAGQSQGWTFLVRNCTQEEIKDIVVAPDLGEHPGAWPFQTEYQNYQYRIETLAGQQTAEVTFDFTQRIDVATTRFTIPFTITVGGTEVLTEKFYVNTTAKPQEEAPQDNVQQETQPAESGGQAQTDVGQTDLLAAEAAGAGVSNGEAVYSGGGSYGGSSGGSGSVPRVIVTGFSTNPQEVRAGSDFTLTIHLKNTSKSMGVQNMLFDLTAPTEGSDEQTAAPAFLPASGSSSIYLEGIKAGGSADISIQMNAKADLLQKPYSIGLSMKYEDGSGEQIEASSAVSIPVKQDARFELSAFEISPESITIGEESNVMCSLYNLGRIKLYNVKAVFEGSCIEREELFIGNVDPGATATIDAMLEGTKDSKGRAEITMQLSYEDEAGAMSVMTKKLQMEVQPEEIMEEAAMGLIEEEEGLAVFPVLPLGAALLAVIIFLSIFAIRRRRRKQIRKEEEELIYELDGPSADEWQ